jgi:hypothetical protein
MDQILKPFVKERSEVSIYTSEELYKFPYGALGLMNLIPENYLREDVAVKSDRIALVKRITVPDTESSLEL